MRKNKKFVLIVALLLVVLIGTAFAQLHQEKPSRCTPGDQWITPVANKNCIVECDKTGEVETTTCCKDNERVSSNATGKFYCKIASEHEESGIESETVETAHRQPTPAFEIIFAISGLLITAYLIKKRQVIK